jgi:transcriptional regulator with XRE-family HTH domain
VTFGALLWQAMGQANLTRAELARRVGVERAAVGKWVDGVQAGGRRRRVLPNASTLAKVLDVLPEQSRDTLRRAYDVDLGHAPTGPLPRLPRRCTECNRVGHDRRTCPRVKRGLTAASTRPAQCPACATNDHPSCSGICGCPCPW